MSKIMQSPTLDLRKRLEIRKQNKWNVNTSGSSMESVFFIATENVSFGSPTLLERPSSITSLRVKFQNINYTLRITTSKFDTCSHTIVEIRKRTSIGSRITHPGDRVTWMPLSSILKAGTYQFENQKLKRSTVTSLKERREGSSKSWLRTEVSKRKSFATA